MTLRRAAELAAGDIAYACGRWWHADAVATFGDCVEVEAGPASLVLRADEQVIVAGRAR